MPKLTVYFLVGTLITVNLIVLYRYQNLRHSKDDRIEVLNNQVEHTKSLIKKTISSIHTNELDSLRSDIMLINESEEEVPIKSIFRSGGLKLILRSTEEGCGLCIENELKIVKNFAQALGNENIAVITTHKNARKLQVFKMTNNIEFEAYYCPDLGFPIEKTSTQVFVFLLDSNLNVHHFFTPWVEMDFLSRHYYSSINQLGFLRKVKE